MAAKNPYKKHIKIFTDTLAKGQNIVVERKGDSVFICDGYTMLKVWIYNYNVYIRPLDIAHFPKMEDGQCIKWSGSALEPEWREPSMARTFEMAEADKECKLTAFLIDDDASCKGRLLRLCVVANTPIAFNEQYIKAVREYCGDMKGHSKYSPIKWEDDIGNGCLVLPVRLPSEKINMIRAMQGWNV